MLTKTTFLALTLIAVLPLALSAQTPTSTPTPMPTPDNSVVRISTNLIRLDVTVTDGKGKPISDIKLDEIEIYENGEKQKITGLTYVSAAPRAIVDKPNVTDKNAVVVPSAPLRQDRIRRTIALVVDDLTLSFESAYHTRRALKKFVDEQMQDGDLVAIVRTGAGIGALQQFTADKRILYAAVDKVKWNPIGNGGISAFAPLESRVPAAEDESEPEPGDRTAEGIAREFDDFRESYFATGTLGALDYVIRGMSELPGRKSVVLFSDGFRLSNTTATGFVENSRTIEPIRRLIESANRASVVIYAMDPRGLVYTGLTAADNTSGRSFQQVEGELSGRREQLFDTQQSLRYISEETGGFALINSNDLSGGVRRVLEDQSYYLVAYEPDGDTFDPLKRKFNKLDVKVLRAGSQIRYRSGFFNVADRETPATAPSTLSPFGQLANAIASPFAVNGINLRLNALFGNDAKGVSYVRSLIHVNAADLSFTDAQNGQKKAVFEVLAMSFGDNGQVVDQLAKSYSVTLEPDAYKRIVDNGFVYNFLFPVKKPGAYQYRIAIRDAQGGKIGSASQFIDVPNLKKKRLTLSSIVLESLSIDAWNLSVRAGAEPATDPMTDTALRRVKQGSVLRFGFEVYNSKTDQTRQPRLSSRIRVFRDGETVLDTKPAAIELLGQTDLQRLKVTRAIALSKTMTPGDHILQIIVTDESDPNKQKVATQFVPFEVVQ